MDYIDEYLNRVMSGQDTKPSDINASVPPSSDGTQYTTEGTITWNYQQHDNEPSNQ